jgi:predicted HicB family RNase H-like nuclease
MSKTYNSILKMMEDDVCDYFTLNFSENIPTESNSAEQTIKQKIQIIIPDLNKPENIPIESNSEIQTIESKEETFDFSNKWEFEQEVTRLITSDLKAAIKFINDGISFYQNEKKEDVKEILAECYKLKSEAYREIEGNGNKLLAVFSNIAYSTLKEN